MTSPGWPREQSVRAGRPRAVRARKMDFLKLDSELNEEDKKDCEDAIREYQDRRKSLSIFCSQDELEAAFNRPKGREGCQIRQYFMFLRAVIVNNIVMSIWALIGWLPHIFNIIPRLQQAGKWGIQDGGSTFDDATDILFLSSYQPSSDTTWTAMIVLGSLTMTLSGPLYYLLNLRQSDFGISSKIVSSLEDDDEESYDGNVRMDDRSPYFAAYSRRPGQRRLRRVLSYLAFAVVCGVPIGINYGLLYVANHLSLQAGHLRARCGRTLLCRAGVHPARGARDARGAPRRPSTRRRRAAAAAAGRTGRRWRWPCPRFRRWGGERGAG